MSNSLVFDAGAIVAAGLGMPVSTILTLGLAQFGSANAILVVDVPEESNGIEVRQQYIPSGYCKGPRGTTSSVGRDLMLPLSLCPTPSCLE